MELKELKNMTVQNKSVVLTTQESITLGQALNLAQSEMVEMKKNPELCKEEFINKVIWYFNIRKEVEDKLLCARQSA